MTHATLTTTAAPPAAVQASSNERIYSLSELVVELRWDPCVRRWLGYARARLWRHGPGAGRYELQAGDCVQEAIRLTLEGRRHFESGTAGDFFGFICSVIDSLISHDAAKTYRHGMLTAIGTEDEPVLGQLNEARLVSSDDSERELLFRDDLEHFLESLETDLATYAKLRAEGLYSTAEQYAAALNTTVSEIRNMDRRLRRRREQWMNREKPTGPMTM